MKNLKPKTDFLQDFYKKIGTGNVSFVFLLCEIGRTRKSKYFELSDVKQQAKCTFI